jgi:regulator of sigma D
MYYLATKSIKKLLYDRNDLLRYAIVFQNFLQYLMVYTVEGFFKIYENHAERRPPVWRK